MEEETPNPIKLAGTSEKQYLWASSRNAFRTIFYLFPKDLS